jgi:hypothetical protein
MKANLLTSCSSRFAGAVAFITVLLLSGFTGIAQVQNPPYGTTWDCLLSGSGQQGIAFLTFSNDFTFSGYQLLVGKQSATSANTGGRNPGGDAERYAEVNTNSVGGGTNLFGFGPVSGPWRFDEKGRLIGYFTEILNQQTTITTNFTFTQVTTNTYFNITNTDGSISTVTNQTTLINTNTTYMTNTIVTSNAVSFTAKVVPGKRLNLVSSTPFGKVTYKGVPQNKKPIPAPISGSWYGAKKKDRQTIVEFFDLLPTDVNNIYTTTNGQGPGISFYGYSMVSVQKKMGFAFLTFQGVVTNFTGAAGGDLSAALGGVGYPKKGAKATSKGFEQPITPINFQAQRQGP